jgi:inosine-uridine nucleoside N-ribohydrolase
MSDETTSASTRPRIIIDCDPGHDDAIAIVVAAHTCDLLGITTVAGNAALERTTHNALVLRDLLGIAVPVHSGAARPLLAEPIAGVDIHGASGLDGAALPAPSRPLDSDDATSFIIDTCRDQPGAWLVAVGPLTNVALALRRSPDLVDSLAGISVMGGGTFGNRTAVGEFNIWADPEAAAAVFGYGGPLVMAGLDVTHQFLATAARIARIDAVGGRLATILAKLLTFFRASYQTGHDAIDGAPETAGTLTRGMTVIDERTVRRRPPANCDVLTTVDADAAFEHVVAAIAAFASNATS